MKKLIAISVVFALVAGAAFAADIAVDVKGHVRLIQGDTGKIGGVTDPASGVSTPTTAAHKPTAAGAMPQFRISASGENDDGTFGAFFRWDAKDWSGWDSDIGKAEGHAWWKPLDALKILIGGGPDGRFEQANVTRWGFYQVAGDVGVAGEGWKFDPSFYGGWGDVGIDLIITPVEALEINIGIPFMSSAWQKVEKVYMKSTLQVAYNIENIGKFAITYKSDVGNKDAVDATVFDPDTGDGLNGEGDVHDTGKVWLYFNLTAIENLSIEVGFGYQLPQTYKDGSSHNYPIAAGVGAKFDAGDFGVKARVQGLFAEQYKDSSTTISAPINVIFDVMPYYAISEALTFHFSVGVDYTTKPAEKAEEKFGDYAKVGFHVNPYITIKSSWWAPNFYAGIRIYTDGMKFKDSVIKDDLGTKDGTSIINWSVPIGIAYSF